MGVHSCGASISSNRETGDADVVDGGMFHEASRVDPCRGRTVSHGVWYVVTRHAFVRAWDCCHNCHSSYNFS